MFVEPFLKHLSLNLGGLGRWLRGLGRRQPWRRRYPVVAALTAAADVPAATFQVPTPRALTKRKFSLPKLEAPTWKLVLRIRIHSDPGFLAGIGSGILKKASF